MKNIFLLLFFPVILFSQVNYSEDISPIIYNNCTECHRVGGAGPMPFTSYEEVASLGMMIKYVTESGYMPPWHANPDYSTFLGERVLTDAEKQLISDWVDGGMIQGDPSLEAQIPEFVEGSVIGEPDAVFTMEEEYLIEGNNQDDYRVFVFSTNFPEDKYLKSIEIIPGNLAAVHHVLVNIDTEGDCAALDASTPEYGYECESGFCVGNIPQLSAGYTPGMVPPIWNNDIGLVLPAGADIAIQMHYAPSSIDQYDQSSVNLFFKDQPVEREVEVLTIVDTQLQIPANEIYTHYNSYQIPFDMSVISVLPHMHLIGKSWLIYAENDGDTIPIINIPDWDFNWQTFYQPEYMLKLPQGYTLHAYATYDNTSSNPTNPNSPPQDMFWCDYTTCEMFFLPFAYVPYQDGDENTYLGNSEDLGCTNPDACNYNLLAIIDDGTCGILDDCGTCHVPCCFNVATSECDYAVSEQSCNNYWADFNVVSDPDQNIFWNTSCTLGCIDSEACNYDINATEDDGSCEYPEEYYNCDGDCLNDLDADGICDELECFNVLCDEWSECILGDCICLNDVNTNGICDEEEQANCSDLSVFSVYQSGDQIIVNVSNSSAYEIFSYPGFILFNSLGDTIAIEEVQYYGIATESIHFLEIQENAVITSDVSLQLHTWFYDFLQCEWENIVMLDNCELDPEPGECDAAIEIFYFNQNTLTCESTWWGGCNGVVPFWSLEACQESCESILIDELSSKKVLIQQLDVLGRHVNSNQKGIFIKLYDNGAVEKELILDK
ncbi:MAG: hypothetical protein CMD23_03285 [Flavobacteriales bacterium]|nr:hypothetical protein [Flavobacteriales bacterium]